MFTFVLILAIVVAIILILVVLIQNPKGGGIASNFSAGNQIFGVKRTTDFIEKLTWGCGAAIIIISLYASSFNAGGSDVKSLDASDPALQEAIKSPLKTPAATPAPATAPQGGATQGPVLQPAPGQQATPVPADGAAPTTTP